jgi:prephenate dehydratase
MRNFYNWLKSSSEDKKFWSEYFYSDAEAFDKAEKIEDLYSILHEKIAKLNQPGTVEHNLPYKIAVEHLEQAFKEYSKNQAGV